MAIPKCRRCGTRLASFSEKDRYEGFCYDCYKYDEGKRAETVILVLFAFVTLVLLLFITGATGYF
jgi:hypothetical protein